MGCQQTTWKDNNQKKNYIPQEYIANQNKKTDELQKESKNYNKQQVQEEKFPKAQEKRKEETKKPIAQNFKERKFDYNGNKFHKEENKQIQEEPKIRKTQDNDSTQNKKNTVQEKKSQQTEKQKAIPQKLEDLSLDFTKSIGKGTSLLGKPNINNSSFEVFIYNKQSQKFEIKTFSQVTINSNLLLQFSKKSSYCNGKDHLYLSGGEKSNNTNKNFWICDLKEKTIELLQEELPVGKTCHSMIYIPDNYVFMVGGNNKSVIIYSISEKSYRNWYKLNKNGLEHTLCYVNNEYLYAFCNNADEGELTFEKTNLRKVTKWELITPIINDNLNFTQKNFGICIHGEELIFIGGKNDDNGYNFKYSPVENKISLFNSEFSEITLREKFFIPFNMKYNFIISEINEEKVVLNYFKQKDCTIGALEFLLENIKTNRKPTKSIDPNPEK